MKRAAAILLTLGAALVAAPAIRATQEPPAELAGLEAEAEQKYAEDDLAAAIAIYDELSRRHTEPQEQARMMIAKAWVEHFAGRWDDSQRSMYRALTLAPDYPFDASFYSQDFVEIFQRNLQRVQADLERRASQQVSAAAEAMSAGDRGAARSLLEQALAIDPAAPEALYNLALLDLQEGSSDAAMAGFQRLLSLHQENAGGGTVSAALRAQTLSSLGLLYFDRRLLEDAEQALQQSLALDPTNATAWTNLGLCRRRLDRPGEALEALQEAYRLRPEDEVVLNNLALAHLDARDWERAAALLTPSTTSHPDSASLWLNLGLAQRGLRQLEEASESFRRAVQLDKGNAAGLAASASTHLALVRFEAGDYAAAMAAARRSLDWLPESVESWIYLGLAQQASGDHDGAQESFAEALDLDPTRSDAANNLGNAHFSAGEYTAAAEAFRHALSLRPDFATARENLRLTEERLAAASSGTTVAEEAPAEPAATTRKAASTEARGRSRETRSPREKGQQKSTTAETAGSGLRLADARHAASGLTAARVEAVDAAGGGASAGLRARDLIVRADGATIESASRLRQLLESLPSAAEIPLDVVRGESILRLTYRAP